MACANANENSCPTTNMVVMHNRLLLALQQKAQAHHCSIYF